MTRDEIMALSGRALDAAIAERVCGWRKALQSNHWLRVDGHRACGCPVLLPGEFYKECTFPPRYSTDLNACREAELAHPQRGRYADTIRDIAGPPTSDYSRTYRLLTFDAATRCRAMLLALEEGQ